VKKFELKRIDCDEAGIFGLLIHKKKIVCVTLELPWKNNEKNISCIPSGIYLFEPIKSPQFGNVYEILEVPNRSHILFHAGNTIKNTKGCVLTGSSMMLRAHWYGGGDYIKKVYYSIKALNQLKGIAGSETSILNITGSSF
jgi:hypothetical protein